MSFCRDKRLTITNNEKCILTSTGLIIICLIVSLLLPSLAICIESSSDGIPIPNFYRIEPWFYRGGRPNTEGIKTLRLIGVKTVVNLERGWFEREPPEVREERQMAKEADIQFIHVPLHPFFKPGSDEVRKILSIVTDSAHYPIFIHCRRGKDRTGIIVALFRVLHQSWSVQRAYEELKSFGHRYILLFWWKNLLTEDMLANSRSIGSVQSSLRFKKGLMQNGCSQVVLYA